MSPDLLVIPPQLLEKMDRALLTEEDAQRVIASCEETGSKLLDNDTGAFVGHLRLGAVTCWVRYRTGGGACLLESIYSHRAVLEEG